MIEAAAPLQYKDTPLDVYGSGDVTSQISGQDLLPSCQPKSRALEASPIASNLAQKTCWHCGVVNAYDVRRAPWAKIMTWKHKGRASQFCGHTECRIVLHSALEVAPGARQLTYCMRCLANSSHSTRPHASATGFYIVDRVQNMASSRRRSLAWLLHIRQCPANPLETP